MSWHGPVASAKRRPLEARNRTDDRSLSGTRTPQVSQEALIAALELKLIRW